MNNLENKEILPEMIFGALKRIVTACPSAVVGGSIALNAVGLINRSVGDIDLFFPEGTNLTRIGFLSEIGEVESDTVTNINGKEIQRTGGKVDGVKVCCFKVSSEELQHSVCEVRGVRLRIQNVNYAVQAKIAYAKNNPKHQTDFDEIDGLLNPSPIDKKVYTKDHLDFAYLTGVFNVIGMDGLHKEIQRLKIIGINPHNIIDTFNQKQ